LVYEISLVILPVKRMPVAYFGCEIIGGRLKSILDKRLAEILERFRF